MRVGIDARLVAYQRGGISTYVQELVAALATLECEDRFCLLGSRNAVWQGGLPEGVTSRRLWTPPHHRWEQSMLPIELGLMTFDVLHSPDFIPPFRRRCPAVITVHDLDFLRSPESKSSDSLQYYGQVGKAVAQSEGVMAISETTKLDMVQMLGASPDKIDVVHLGVSPYYRPLSDNPAVEAFCQEHGLPPTFMLWVSTIEPRKNLSCLLHAVTETTLPASLEKLVVVGSKGWRAEEELALIDQLGLQDRVILHGPASRDELLYLYNAAWVLAYPSLYEGFGLPPLESMACGTPVISSTAPALTEVLGDAALFCDPNDPSTLSRLLMQLAEDAALRDQIREVGLRHAATYTWLKTAQETLAVYHKAAAA